MATLTIRNLDDGVKSSLRIRAAENGRSLEAEARETLSESVSRTDRPKTGQELLNRIRRRFEPFGDFKLELLPRDPPRDPPDFR